MILCDVLLYLLASIITIAFVYFLVPTLITVCIRLSFTRRIKSCGMICLTFDDGADSEWTPKILDILKRFNIRATFFLLAERSQENPEVVRTILQFGHEIGNHAFQHNHPWITLPNRYLSDLQRCNRILTSLAGKKHIALFRPTYGKVNLLTLLFALVHRMRLVYWDVDPHDYKCTSSKEVIDKVVQKIGDSRFGAVVLLHDCRINSQINDAEITVEALSEIVDTLRKKGYRFGTISEALEKSKIVFSTWE